MSDIEEVKLYYTNGKPKRHHYLKDGYCHGEFKYWHANGQLWKHFFMKDNKNITDQIEEVVVDILNITNEEKLMIKLKFGIDCL